MGIWFDNFLCDRSQFVRVLGGCSNVAPVVSGVSQNILKMLPWIIGSVSQHWSFTLSSAAVWEVLIIYVWKILEGHVLNLTASIKSRYSPRRGRYCEMSHVNHGHIGSLCFNSFRLKSCRLFNCRPRNIRNISSCSVLTFKRGLDAFLKTIPDNPLATNTSNYLDHLLK